MKTKTMKHLLPLAALALVTAACDPFPAKPGGDPVIVRVTVSAGSTHNETTENSAGGGTVVIDKAWPSDRIYIQFNKPMDGTSMQEYPNYNSDGTFFIPPIDPATVGIKTDPGTAVPPIRAPFTDPGIPYPICFPKSTLTLTGFEEVAGVPLVVNPVTGVKQAGTGIYPVHTSICYSPGSTSDGAMMVIKPAIRLTYGSTYRVTGTVKDYEGKPLNIDVTIKVDQRPQPYALDGYTNQIKWFNSTTAVSYDLNRSLTGAAGSFTPLATGLLPADLCFAAARTGTSTSAGACYYDDIELKNNTAYYYQLVEVGGVGAGTRQAAAAHATTLGPLEIFLSATTAGTPPVAVPAVIAAVWYQIVLADGYAIQRAPDVAGAPGVWGTAVNVAADPVNDPMTYSDSTVTTGVKYWYRITPTYPSGFVAEPGLPTSFVAP
jgi:hypothetical protein